MPYLFRRPSDTRLPPWQAKQLATLQVADLEPLELLELSRASLPHLARRPARAAATAYLAQLARFLDPNAIFNSEVQVLLAERAPGARRAGEYRFAQVPPLAHDPFPQHPIRWSDVARGHRRTGDYSVSVTFPPPDAVSQTVASGFVQHGAPGPRRAAVYTQTVTFIVGDAPLTQGVLLLPARASVVPRAGAAAYTVTLPGLFVDSLSDHAIAITTAARGPRRAAAASYFVGVGPILPQEPFASCLEPSVTTRAHGPRRTSDYQILRSPQIGDGTPLQNAVAVPDRALGRRRAADYGIFIKAVVEDGKLTGAYTAVTQVAPGFRRTAASAYTTDAAFAALVLSAPPEDQRALYPSVAFGPRRAADCAVSVRFVVPDEPQPVIGLVLPQRTPGPRRASDYSISSKAPPASEPQVAAIQSVPVAAPGYRRGGELAIAARFVVPDEPQPVLGLVLPQTAPRARKSTPDAYLVNLSVPLQSEPRPGSTIAVTHAAPGARRAANSVYFVGTRFQWPDEPHVTTFQQLPDRAAGPRRAGAGAYTVATRFVFGDEVPDSETECYPDLALGARRAASVAYWVSARFVVQSEPSVATVLLAERAPGARRATDYRIADAMATVETTDPLGESAADTTVTKGGAGSGRLKP